MPDITEWDYITALMGVGRSMVWWNASGVDRTPAITHGSPLGWLDRCRCDTGGDPNGQLLVTAGEVFFAGERWPNRDEVSTKMGDCADKWGVPLTVQYARCHPTRDEHGTPPPADYMLEYARELYADANAIWSALVCATRAGTEVLPARTVATGYRPIVRDIGPCAGFEFSLTGTRKVCPTC